MPRGGGGTPQQPAPPAPEPVAKPKPEESAAPPPPPVVLKPPPKAEPRPNALPLPDSKTKRPPTPPPVRAVTKPTTTPSTGSAGTTPAAKSAASATPGLEFGPPGPGVPTGTETGGDWYLASVQQKIWMIWNQQIKTGYTQSVGVTFTIQPDGTRHGRPAHRAVRRLAARPRGAARGPQRGAVRSTSERVWPEIIHDPGALQADVLSSPRRSSPSRASPWARQPPRRDRRPREPPPPRHRHRRPAGAEVRRARLRARSGPTRRARPPAARSRRCCGPTCASRDLSFVQDSLISAIPPLNPQAPKFEDWKGIGANILVVTQAEVANGELVTEVRVHFVDNGQSMLQRRYSGKPDNPRTFAHAASDDIMTLTQYKGVAKTRIAFVSDRDTSKERPSKELYIVDYDGFNPRRVTVNGSLNILPAWRPDGAAIAYVSYRQGVAADLPRQDLRGTERREPERREGRRPGVLARLQPRRQEPRVREQPRGQHRRLRRGRRRLVAAAAHDHAGQGHGAVLQPDRAGDRVHLRPHRHAAALADGRGRA